MIVHGFAGNDVHPPRFGASQRLFGLYRGIALRHDTHVLALVPNRHPGPDDERVGGFHLVRHREWYTSPAWRLERAGLAPMFALALPGHGARGRAIAARLAGDADVVVADLALAGVLEHAGSALRVLHAHNVEYDHFRSAGPRVLARDAWAESLRGLEARACAFADLVVTVSAEDAERMHELYGVPAERLLTVANGYDESELRPPSPDERRRARAALGVADGDLVAVFVGSDVPHNQDGLKLLIEHVLPQCGSLGAVLVVVGSVTAALTDAELDRFATGGTHGTRRLIARGEVASTLPFLHAADVGLNPVTGGSGSNVKLPTYLAAGLEVVTTPHGLRGYPDLAGTVTVAERAGFADALAALRPELARRRASGEPARPAPVALANYAWGELGARLGDTLETRVRQRRAERGAAAPGIVAPEDPATGGSPA
jgi:glycosyltransferase involved in cell wall biosynthesis